MLKHTLFLCFGLIFSGFYLHAQPLPISVSAESAILMNADSGIILYEKKAHTLQYPASITKIATALFALRNCDNKMDALISAEQDAVASITEEARRRSNYTVPAYWLVPGGSHIGIKTGEELSLKDLMYGLLVASGNDAANVIAQHSGGTIPKFMSDLNIYMKEIGCKNTTFTNPHGLYDPKHQTTAYDMALIMREALKNSTFREIISTVRYKRPKTNKQESTTLVQTNRLLKKGKFYYPKALGGKTGYLSLAGNTLVVAAKDGDRTLIAVLLKCKERDDLFNDAIKMFDTAFNQPKVQRLLLKAGPQKFALEMAGAKKAIPTYIKEDVNIEYYPAEEPKFKCLLQWIATTPQIKKDQVVGELRLQREDGALLKTVSLLAQEDVSPTWSWSLKHLFE